MNPPMPAPKGATHLCSGELVEVRSAAEILATLDDKGELEGLPFMPEMMRFCGRRLRVFRTAHKTCDTITGHSLGRRMERCVHLEDARCDGSGHGRCQAACLIFWKEAWLKRVEPPRAGLLWRLISGSTAQATGSRSSGGPCVLEGLERHTVREGTPNAPEATFRCQATQLLDATTPLAWWEPSQYLRDWLSGNWPLWILLRSAFFRVLYKLVVLGRGYRLKIWAYDCMARLLGEPTWRYWGGTLKGKTPSEPSTLQPGELVAVKSNGEILDTLNGNMNRGLGFSPEMVTYCGGTYRVRSRVERLINEKTGKMMRMSNDCIILEDVICRSDCSTNRLFCPRGIYPFWREIWLRRVPGESYPGQVDP